MYKLGKKDVPIETVVMTFDSFEEVEEIVTASDGGTWGCCH